MSQVKSINESSAPGKSRALDLFAASKKNWIVAISIAICISIFFMLINTGRLPSDYESLIDFAFGTSIGVSLWMSMGQLNSRLAPKLDWFEKPFRSLGIVLIANIFVAALALSIVRFVFIVGIYGVTIERWLAREQVGEYIITILIGLFIAAIYQGAYFVRLWKDSVVQGEQLKSANLAAKYEALNAQINPHFLFNSLNVLSALVRSDATRAEEFIAGLSQVYRYVLEVRQESAVDLHRELTALDAYAKLVETRFGKERFSISNTLPAGLECQVVPLALQMLVENAVKHNGATKKNPLLITLAQEDGYLTMSNNRVPMYDSPEGNGIGLDNIRERYLLASGQQIIVEDSPERFTIKLPMIHG